MVCCHIDDQDQKTLGEDSETNDESKCSDFSINGFRYLKVKTFILFTFQFEYCK